jgi:hypothetical protein
MKCREEEWQPTIGDKFILVASGEKVNAIRRPDAKGIDKFLSSSRNSLKSVIGEVSEGFPIDKFFTCTYRYGGR